MRQLTDHHDGHGLNESIVLTTDEPDASGAAHRFEATIHSEVVAMVQFQQGPRTVTGSHAGVTEAVMLVTMIDRLRGFQAGPYACRENAIILTKLEECLFWTKARADARAKRGVLGTNQK